MVDDFPVGPARFAALTVFAAFRCECGQLTAMAEQQNGDAAMIHGTPYCDRFESLRSQEQALAYFRALEQVPLTDAVRTELGRNSAHA